MKLYLPPKNLSLVQKLDYITDKDFRKNTDAKIQSIAFLKLKKATTFEEFKDCLKSDIAPLSSKQFDRKKIREAPFYKEALKILKKSVEETDDEILKAYAEGRLADLSGIRMKRNRFGTSGSYRVKDLEGKVVAIFKPIKESPHGPYNPHFWIRKRNWLQTFLINRRCINEEKGAKAEVFAYKTARFLNFQDLVPKTAVATYTSNSFYKKDEFLKGSFQLFVEKAQDGYKQMDIPEWMPPCLAKKCLPKTLDSTNKVISTNSFHQFALLQCLIGNIDGNYGNMLFKEGSIDIISIDAWFSMPHSPPRSYLDRRGMHTWDTLPYADCPIPVEYAGLLTDNIKVFLAEIEKYYGKNSQEEVQFHLRLNNLIIASEQGHTWKQYTATT